MPMSITALDDLVPPLTDEQKAAAVNEILPLLEIHPGKRFMVRDFPGGTPDLSRLRACLDRHFYPNRWTETAASPEGFVIMLKAASAGGDAT